MDIDQCRTPAQMDDYFSRYIEFWRTNTYDAFDYEAAICDIIPGHGAILGGKGPIQTREDFERYPFDDIPRIFWETYTPRLESLRRVTPAGMKAYGGCGYGIFETAQDLVGMESFCMMQYIDPELFADIFKKIEWLYRTLWTRMASEWGDIFVFFRMGDDLGHRTSTMLSPDTIRTYILPLYKMVIDIAHHAGKRFLLHSCGNIFEVMPDIIALGIDAKHSNEDQIAPFGEWIERYGSQIGLFGGFDMNELILNPYDYVYEKVLREGVEFRARTQGYGLGSGNSIPDYMSEEGFRAMVEAAKEIRRREKNNK